MDGNSGDGVSRESSRVVGSASYAIYSFMYRGGLFGYEADLIRKLGIQFDRDGRPTALDIKAIEFDHFLVMHLVGSSRRIDWFRAGGAARRRHVFVFVNRGSLTVGAESGNTEVLAGLFAHIAPGAAPVTILPRGEIDVVTLSFDVAEVAPLVPAIAVGGVSVHRSVVFRAVSSFLVGIAQSPPSRRLSDALALRALVREVARNLATEPSALPRTASTVELARQIIKRRYRSPAFKANDIGVELEMSRRSVERAFAETDLSAAGEVRRYRVRHAYELLVAGPPMTLESIASESGFSSPEVMRRALLREYGATVRSLRDDGSASALS